MEPERQQEEEDEDMQVCPALHLCNDHTKSQSLSCSWYHKESFCGIDKTPEYRWMAQRLLTKQWTHIVLPWSACLGGRSSHLAA